MSSNSAIDTQIAQVNQRLKTARLGFQIERRGALLSLRGTLPPRPDSMRLRPYQQRISLGLAATKAGLKQTEQQAKIIAAELIQNTFDWRNYLKNPAGKPLSQQSLQEKTDSFQQYFFTEGQGNQKAASLRTTWTKAYAPYLKKLAAIAQQYPSYSLSEGIYATAQSTRPNSRSRQICCTALNAFADFLRLELPTPLKNFAGSYSHAKTAARTLPADEQIMAGYYQIPNPTWRFVYGIMATYGLRNHEVFFCDYQRLVSGDSEAVVEVQAVTKTGSHEVWPFYPEWVDRFELSNVQLPAVNTDLGHTTLQRIGQQVTAQFRRYDLPFSPYDLRHAWAVRTIHFGLPDTVSAKMMGHSVTVHNRTYHRWITHRDQQQAVDAALSRRSLL
ncbi:MAG: site-specific integrase [Leptolyngbyaceae cyanobacterium SM1_1_3]|nr:site-specific integrase [Leptolyngbyaceae cyanobacterium SM1_1_3]NJM85563.1 site-specific integrase [Leptolyngbyaceae cyanobacterium RM2_2_21]NJN04257.1 site-specific integrase [Leptolyngbyaceae cyanobacterium RM1_1_2]